jgi:hypothetical protein
MKQFIERTQTQRQRLIMMQRCERTVAKAVQMPQPRSL